MSSSLVTTTYLLYAVLLLYIGPAIFMAGWRFVVQNIIGLGTLHNSVAYVGSLLTSRAESESVNPYYVLCAGVVLILIIILFFTYVLVMYCKLPTLSNVVITLLFILVGVFLVILGGNEIYLWYFVERAQLECTSRAVQLVEEVTSPSNRTGWWLWLKGAVTITGGVLISSFKTAITVKSKILLVRHVPVRLMRNGIGAVVFIPLIPLSVPYSQEYLSAFTLGIINAHMQHRFIVFTMSLLGGVTFIILRGQLLPGVGALPSRVYGPVMPYQAGGPLVPYRGAGPVVSYTGTPPFLAPYPLKWYPLYISPFLAQVVYQTGPVYPRGLSQVRFYSVHTNRFIPINDRLFVASQWNPRQPAPLLYWNIIEGSVGNTYTGATAIIFPVGDANDIPAEEVRAGNILQTAINRINRVEAYHLLTPEQKNDAWHRICRTELDRGNYLYHPLSGITFNSGGAGRGINNVPRSIAVKFLVIH